MKALAGTARAGSYTAGAAVDNRLLTRAVQLRQLRRCEV